LVAFRIEAYMWHKVKVLKYLNVEMGACFEQWNTEMRDKTCTGCATQWKQKA